MKTSVNFFDGLDHQYTPEKQLHQIDAHMIFTMREQLLDLAAYMQWQNRRRADIPCSL